MFLNNFTALLFERVILVAKRDRGTMFWGAKTPLE